MGCMGQSNIEYDKEFYNKLEEAQEFEDFVYNLLYHEGIPVVGFNSKKYQFARGENMAGIEIKHDKKYEKTGNLYIETAEKRYPGNPEYAPSGINRGDNSWLYLIGDYNIIYIFPVKYLKRWEGGFRAVEITTSRGYLMPENIAIQRSIKILKPNNSDRIV